TNTLTATAAGNGIGGNPVTFTATTRGNLTVTTTTTGSTLPSGYAASFDGPGGSGGSGGTGPVATNGSTTFGALAAGSYMVTLSAMPATCGVTSTSANPQTITVPALGTVTATFAMQCGEVSGQGQIGTGSPTPGNNVVTFDFDVRAGLTGRFTGTD